MPTNTQDQRLANIEGWLRTAKENLPAISEGPVLADRVSQMSALLDRLHQQVARVRARIIEEKDQRAA